MTRTGRTGSPRLLVFGVLALLLALCMGLLVWPALAERFAAPSWTSYLGANEKATLEQGLGARGDPDPGRHDPVLRLPGLSLIRVGAGEYRGRAATVFHVRPTGDEKPSAQSQLERIARSWAVRELRLRGGEGRLMAAAADGSLYLAEMAGASSHSQAPQVVVTRLREQDLERRARLEAAVPGWHDALLPALPQGPGNIEQGARGRAGYSMLFTMRAGRELAFRVLRDELLERGWEVFPEAEAARGLMRKAAPGARSVLLRHPRAPIGCQLMVAPHPKAPARHSQAFISLL